MVNWPLAGSRGLARKALVSRKRAGNRSGANQSGRELVTDSIQRSKRVRAAVERVVLQRPALEDVSRKKSNN
jgi:hypothetical protein